MPKLEGAIEERLRTAPPEADPKARVDVLLQCAYDIRELEQWDRIVELCDEAHTLSEQIGYTSGIARSLGMLSFVQYIRSDYKKALASCIEALRLVGDDPSSEGKLRGVLAMIHWSLGNFDEGLRHTERSRELSVQSADQVSEAFAYTTRGGILHSLGEYEQSIAAHLDALELFRAHDYTAGIARALSGLGSAYQSLGLHDSALECHNQSLDLARSVDHRIGISRALNDLGELQASEGNLDSAIELHQQSLAIRREEGYRNSAITSLVNLGACYRKKGLSNQALEELREALQLAEEIEAKPKMALLHGALADFYEQTGQFAEAVRHLRAHDQIKTELSKDHSATRQKALELEAQLEMTRKDSEIHRLRNVELREKNDELARLLDELQRTQVQLANSEKMAALGGLVAAVTHEVNNPLGVIRSSADIAMRCADKMLAGIGDSATTLELLRSNAQLVSGATQRIEALISRLKSFAGIDRSEYGRFQPLKALDEAVQLLEPEFRDRIQIQREYREVPDIYGFGAEISQVFMHLVKNAT
ncbi:MAG TPA: tetratricopeptide repeat protein, partial [Bryobacteraceae bacterium]|nr:tetratricopeptide repeat protein [Bryobacteraceae bacterium]